MTKPKPQAPQDDELRALANNLSVRELAALMDTSIQNVHKWRKEGCPASKPGKAYVFRLKDVVDWKAKRMLAKQKGFPDGIDLPESATEIDEEGLPQDGKYIKKELIEILLTGSGTSRVQAAKLLLELDEGSVKDLPQAVAFVEIDNVNGVMQATGKVSVTCPSCQEPLEFVPL